MTITTRSFNIVLVGEGMAVSQIRSTDFKFPGLSIEEQLRAPVVVVMTAGPYLVQGTPDRYLIGATGVPTDQEHVENIKNNAEELVGLIGQRSVKSVGLNLDAEVLVSSKEALARCRDRIVRPDFFDAIGKHGELRPMFDVSVHMPANDANFVRLRTHVPETVDRVIVDLNYHFDLANNPRHQRAVNAIWRFAATMQDGEDLIARAFGALELASVVGGGER